MPVERRLVSWHGAPEPLVDFEHRAAHLMKTPAALYKLVVFAQQPGEALLPLELLANARRDDLIAFAAGAVGTWTRLVAPYLGAPWVYGSAGDDPAAPGQLPVARLLADYALPELRPVTALFGVVGMPALHSLSPRLHNAAYRALGLPYLFLPFEAPALGDFWLEVVEDATLPDCGMPLRGLAVTTPFKASAVAVAGALSPLAERLSVANSLVCRDGVWEGDSTDGEGVLNALGWRGVPVAGARVAIVGAGGAGRVAGLVLSLAGAAVTMVNRDAERGAAVAAELGVAFQPLAELLGGGLRRHRAGDAGRPRRDRRAAVPHHRAGSGHGGGRADLRRAADAARARRRRRGRRRRRRSRGAARPGARAVPADDGAGAAARGGARGARADAAG